MTDLVLDSEFLENGSTIDLISIALINRDTDAEYYAVNADADWRAIKKRGWLCENVVPHLPLALPVRKSNWAIHPGEWTFEVDKKATIVKPRWVIANEVRDFILAAENPRLCAWYASYDMVALNQLWGPMVTKPDGIPWWCWEFKQEQDRRGITDDDLPPQESGQHDALADARTLLARMEWLEQRTAAR